jgi:CubicO group peptidase (beta-lactamase class C family)
MAQNGLVACLKVSVVSLFMLFFQVLNAQYDFSSLDAKLLKYQKAFDGNVVALVYKDGKIVHTKELGLDFKANEQVRIANCSQWLTAALVMTFVDEGKLSLDDKVMTFLPIFERYSKRYVTIRQCLNGTTGIEGESINNAGMAPTLEEQVDGFASRRDIKAPPGTVFRYSNVGLNIAGRILEIVGKKTFDQLANQRLFKPLGMKNTTFQDDFGRAPDPCTGAHSTAADYMNFLEMILDKGMFKGKRILSEAAVAQMEQAQTTPQIIKYMPPAGVGYSYGFGNLLLEQDDSGKGICVASPSMLGTWPVVDYNKGYAFIIFVKKFVPDLKKEVFLDIKSSIDEALSVGK